MYVLQVYFLKHRQNLSFLICYMFSRTLSRHALHKTYSPVHIGRENRPIFNQSLGSCPLIAVHFHNFCGYDAMMGASPGCRLHGTASEPMCRCSGAYLRAS